MSVDAARVRLSLAHSYLGQAHTSGDSGQVRRAEWRVIAAENALIKAEQEDTHGTS